MKFIVNPLKFINLLKHTLKVHNQYGYIRLLSMLNGKDLFNNAIKQV